MRRRTIGRFPARSERIDFTMLCRTCRNAPTCLVKLGPVPIERTCHTCGGMEFLDATAVAYQMVNTVRMDYRSPCRRRDQIRVTPVDQSTDDIERRCVYRSDT